MNSTAEVFFIFPHRSIKRKTAAVPLKDALGNLVLPEPAIDLLHDPLNPLNRGGDQLIRPWASPWPSK
jgi:hypothetical protein